MKCQKAMQASQLEEVALFLEEHPGFSPELHGENAIVWGFRIGGCLLTLAEMARLVAAGPHFDARGGIAAGSSVRVRADGMTLVDRVDQVLTRPRERR